MTEPPVRVEHIITVTTRGLANLSHVRCSCGWDGWGTYLTQENAEAAGQCHITYSEGTREARSA